MIYLGLVTLLVVLRCVYLELALRRIGDEVEAMQGMVKRHTDTMTDRLRPLGNVDVLHEPSNVVPLERTRA